MATNPLYIQLTSSDVFKTTDLKNLTGSELISYPNIKDWFDLTNSELVGSIGWVKLSGVAALILHSSLSYLSDKNYQPQNDEVEWLIKNLWVYTHNYELKHNIVKLVFRLAYSIQSLQALTNSNFDNQSMSILVSKLLVQLIITGKFEDELTPIHCLALKYCIDSNLYRYALKVANIKVPSFSYQSDISLNQYAAYYFRSGKILAELGQLHQAYQCFEIVLSIPDTILNNSDNIDPNAYIGAYKLYIKVGIMLDHQEFDMPKLSCKPVRKNLYPIQETLRPIINDHLMRNLVGLSKKINESDDSFLNKSMLKYSAKNKLIYMASLYRTINESQLQDILACMTDLNSESFIMVLLDSVMDDSLILSLNLKDDGIDQLNFKHMEIEIQPNPPKLKDMSQLLKQVQSNVELVNQLNYDTILAYGKAIKESKTKSMAKDDILANQSNYY